MKKVSRVLLVMLLIFVMFSNITVKANDDYSTLNDETKNNNIDTAIADEASEPAEESKNDNLDNSSRETESNNTEAAIADEASEPTEESKNNNLDNSSNGETKNNNIDAAIANESSEPTDANNESDGIDTGEVVTFSVPVAKSEPVIRSSSSTNMADYLTGVTINAPKVGDNIYQIVPGTRYEVSLHFSEGENLQFPNSGSMTYQLPSGFENVCEDDNNVTKPYVLHAEANAITKLARSNNNSDGSTLYVTASPCIECAKLIIQSGIKRVVYGEKYRLTDGIELMERAGIEIVYKDIEGLK